MYGRPYMLMGMFRSVSVCVRPLLMDLTGTKLCIRQRYNENHSNEISIFSSRGALGRPRELTCESDYN